MNREEELGNNIKSLLPYFIVLTGIIIDQVSKFFVIRNFKNQSYEIIDKILSITVVENTGSAFGILKGYNIIIIFISIIVVIVSSYYLLTSKDFLMKIVLALIISGAIGNIIDRIRLGYVIDFIDMTIWPMFNFADSFITIGSIILILYINKKK